MTAPHPRPGAPMAFRFPTPRSTTVLTSTLESNCRANAGRPSRIGPMTRAMTMTSHDGSAAATGGERR